MNKLTGSMEALSAMQLTADTEGLDAESKTLLHSKEVLAVILQGTIEEYCPLSLTAQIMGNWRNATASGSAEMTFPQRNATAYRSTK